MSTVQGLLVLVLHVTQIARSTVGTMAAPTVRSAVPSLTRATLSVTVSDGYICNSHVGFTNC